MTAWLAAHVWVALFVAFVLGGTVYALISIRLKGGPEDPADTKERARWMGHW